MDRALSLRATFNEDPYRYDRVRPRYPPELFDDLVALARLPERARLLEIGPGTGQATVPLAERGYAVVAVELGAGLAAVARRNLAAAAALGAGGALAVVPTWHVAGGHFESRAVRRYAHDVPYLWELAVARKRAR